MNRRDVLAGVTLSTIPLAGCLGGIGDGSQGDEYERCEANYVWVNSLPTPAEEEVRGAIEDGTYETDSKLLVTDVIDVDSTLIKGPGVGSYYEGVVEDGDDGKRLRIEEIRPNADPVYLMNSMKDDLTVDVHIEYEDELIVDETVEIEGKETIQLGNDDQFRYGTYSAEVKIEEVEFAGNQTWEVNEAAHQWDISIDENGLWMADRVHSSPLHCEWTDEGEVNLKG